MEKAAIMPVKTLTETEQAYRAGEKIVNRQLVIRFIGLLAILAAAVVTGSVLGTLAR